MDRLVAVGEEGWRGASGERGRTEGVFERDVGDGERAEGEAAGHRLQERVDAPGVVQVFALVKEALKGDSDQAADAAEEDIRREFLRRELESVKGLFDSEDGFVVAEDGLCRDGGKHGGNNDGRECAEGEVTEQDFEHEDHAGDGCVEDGGDARGRAAADEDGHLLA